MLTGCKHPESHPEPPPIPVVLATVVERAGSTQLIRRGTVSVGARYRLGFSLGGVIATVCCRTGDLVKRGQVLATLRHTEADARLRAANAARSKATRDFDNSSELVRTGALAPNARDEARDQLDAANAQIDLASEVLRLTTLTSPVSGTVQQRFAEPGETVGPAMPVLQVEEVGKIVVRIGVTERDLKRIGTGATASIIVEGSPEKISAHVSNMAPMPDATDGLFTVEVRPDKKDVSLVPGGLVFVQFHALKTGNYVRVPMDSLVERRGKTGLFVLATPEETTTIVWRAVKVDHIEDKSAYVSDGLAGDERIVAEGAYFLDDGVKVKVLAQKANTHGS
jgi:RND family efflux transporter MFP subunit